MLFSCDKQPLMCKQVGTEQVGETIDNKPRCVCLSRPVTHGNRGAGASSAGDRCHSPRPVSCQCPVLAGYYILSPESDVPVGGGGGGETAQHFTNTSYCLRSRTMEGFGVSSEMMYCLGGAKHVFCGKDVLHVSWIKVTAVTASND